MATGAAAASSLPALPCPSVPVPAHTVQQVIAPRVAVNGRLMSIVAATSALPPAAFAQFYKTLWKGSPGKPLYVENAIAAWDVVAHQQDQCFYTVQIQPDGRGGSVALLGIGALDQDYGTGPSDFPAPGDAQPLTHMRSDDSGRIGDTWVVYTDNAAAAVVAWYAQNLQALGWQPDTPPGHSPAGTVLMFSKGHRHAGIVIAPFRTGAMVTYTVMSQ